MRDLLYIIIIERRTLLWGLSISFLVALPFTFIPAMLESGWSPGNLLHSFPEATAYAFGFSVSVLIAAVAQNYQSLLERKRIFDTPALKSLDFYGRIEGAGSIARELETFLLGKMGDYFFRLNIPEPGTKKVKIEVVPLVNWEKSPAVKKSLARDEGFRQHFFFGMIISLKEDQLDEPFILKDKLQALAIQLDKLQAVPLKMGEKICY